MPKGVYDVRREPDRVGPIAHTADGKNLFLYLEGLFDTRVNTTWDDGMPRLRREADRGPVRLVAPVVKPCAELYTVYRATDGVKREAHLPVGRVEPRSRFLQLHSDGNILGTLRFARAARCATGGFADEPP